jgi:hypothetical protein
MPDLTTSEDVVPSLLKSCADHLEAHNATEVVEFGQFVNLWATIVGEDAEPQPLILTITDAGVRAAKQQEAQAKRSSGEVAATATRRDLGRGIDIYGGLPLEDVIAGTAPSLFEPQQLLDVELDDVAAILNGDAVDRGGRRWRAELGPAERAALSRGEPVVALLVALGTARGEWTPTASTELVRLRPALVRATATSADALLANGEVEVPGGTVPISLTADVVDAVLSGRLVVVPATPGQPPMMVAFTGEGAAGIASERFVVTDLAGFLMDKLVPRADGGQQDVALGAEQIKALRAGERIVADAGGSEIELELAPLDSPPEFDRAGGWRVPNVLPDSEWLEQQRESAALAHPNLPAKTTIAPSWSATPAEPAPAAPPPPRIIQVALLLPWQQVWTLEGYSRGRLLHTLALAPLEEATIELSTWDRRKKTLEQSSQTDTEQEFATNSSTSDTVDISAEMTKSNEFAWQLGGSLNASYRPGVAEIAIEAHGQVDNKSSLDSTAKTTAKKVQESTSKAAARVKASRTTKITETIEQGVEQKVTRRLRNPNLSRTLTFDHFETLAHYHVTLRFAAEQARLCAMVDNPISVRRFEPATVRVNETALRDALLDQSLVDGFAACRLLAEYGFAKGIDRDMQAAANAREVEASKQAPKTEDAAKAGTQAERKVSREERALVSLVTGMRASWDKLEEASDSFMTGTAKTIHAGGIPNDESRTRVRRYLYRRLLLHYFPSLAQALRDLPDGGLGTEHARSISLVLPGVAQSPSPDTLSQLTDREKEDAALREPIDGAGGGGLTWNWSTGKYREYGFYQPDDAGLGGMLARFNDAYLAWQSAAASQDEGDSATSPAGVLAKGVAEQKSVETAQRLEMAYGLERLASAQERQEALLAHINAHLSYYRFVLFQALPPAEQLEILTTSGGLRLPPGAFEPQVVAMSGDKLAVPLHVELSAQLTAFRDGLLDGVEAVAGDSKGRRVTVPTAGITMNTRLGDCSASEAFVEDSRTIELRRLAALAEHEELEAERRRKMLEAGTLDDPHAERPPLEVKVQTSPSATGAPTP